MANKPKLLKIRQEQYNNRAIIQIKIYKCQSNSERKDYDEITNRTNQLFTSLVNSNQVDSSILKTVSNLLNGRNRSQFSLEPVTQSTQSAFGASGEDNPNLFTINPHNPQQVLIKGSTLTFLSNNNMYNLNDPNQIS